MGGEQRKFQALCAATRLHVYIIEWKNGIQNTEGGGAAGGRAATPFAAEREELPRGKILEELFDALDALIDFFHVL
jgi:hypothetical protein